MVRIIAGLMFSMFLSYGALAGENAGDCAAIAHTPDGAFGVSYGFKDCAEAKSTAVEECKKHSQMKENCPYNIVLHRNKWLWITFCKDRKGGSATYVSAAETIPELLKMDAQQVRTSDYSPSECRLAPDGFLHSAGIHEDINISPYTTHGSPLISKRWIAVAGGYSSRGVQIATSGGDTSEEAEAQVLKICRGGSKGYRCTAFSANTGCLYVAMGRNSSGNTTWGHGISELDSLINCERSGYTCKAETVRGLCVE